MAKPGFTVRSPFRLLIHKTQLKPRRLALDGNEIRLLPKSERFLQPVGRRQPEGPNLNDVPVGEPGQRGKPA